MNLAELIENNPALFFIVFVFLLTVMLLSVWVDRR